MNLFDYLKEVDYAQGLILKTNNWRMDIPYDSKEFIPYTALVYTVESDKIYIDENGKLVIPIRRINK